MSQHQNVLPPKRKEKDADADDSYFARPSQAERRKHLEDRGEAILEQGIRSIKVLREVDDPRLQETKVHSDKKGSQTVKASPAGWFDMEDGWKVRVNRAVFASGRLGNSEEEESSQEASTTELRLEISKFETQGGNGTKDNPGQELPDGKNSLTINLANDGNQVWIDGMSKNGGLGTPFDHRESPHQDEQQNTIRLTYVENYVDRAQDAVLAIQNAAIGAAQTHPA